MDDARPSIIPWPFSARTPDEAAIRRVYEREGMHPYRWSNAPGDVYAPHVHDYDKVLYVVSGSITFGLPEHGESLTLRPGDRLNLPAGVRHHAVVGQDSVTCLEAHSPRVGF